MTSISLLSDRKS
uniref:Uncharacterized protein n=1 Tax=Anguilla anguilla TaxID=7936 RepID=A0A0E9PG37_ANGAN